MTREVRTIGAIKNALAFPVQVKTGTWFTKPYEDGSGKYEVRMYASGSRLVYIWQAEDRESVEYLVNRFSAAMDNELEVFELPAWFTFTVLRKHDAKNWQSYRRITVDFCLIGFAFRTEWFDEYMWPAVSKIYGNLYACLEEMERRKAEPR
jgi:hypothetical protein